MQRCQNLGHNSPAPDKQSVISIDNKTTWVCLQKSLSLPSFTFTTHSIQTWLLCESALRRTMETLTVNWNFSRNLFILIKRTLRPASWQLTQPCVILLLKLTTAILGFAVSWSIPPHPLQFCSPALLFLNRSPLTHNSKYLGHLHFTHYLCHYRQSMTLS